MDELRQPAKPGEGYIYLCPLVAQPCRGDGSWLIMFPFCFLQNLCFRLVKPVDVARIDAPSAFHQWTFFRVLQPSAYALGPSLNEKIVHAQMPRYSESDLQKALREIHQGTSQRSAAKRWRVPRTTLQDRLRGGSSHAEAHELRQRFSRQQEKLLSRWVFNLSALGVPPTCRQFEEFANRILVVHGDHQPLGKHWVQGFVRRNSEVTLAKGKISTLLFPPFSVASSLEPYLTCIPNMRPNRAYVFI